MKILGGPLNYTETYSKWQTEESCRSILKKQNGSLSGEPFFLVDLKNIHNKIALWNTHLPNIQPSYAMKCNPNPLILKIMSENNFIFDVASKKEMEQITKYAIDNKNIILSTPCKLNSYIKYASANDVQIMTFDNVNELHKIKKFHPNAKLILRMATADSTCEFSQKFGAAKGDWTNLIATCNDLGLQLSGVSFHAEDEFKDAKKYFNFISDAKDIFNLGAKYGFKMEMLNIGGDYWNYLEHDSDFLDFANTINKALETYFGGMDIRINAEAGRFMVASACTLVTKVIAVKHSIDSVKYFVNDGVYGSFSNIKNNPIQQCPELLSTSTHKEFKICSISGPNGDQLIEALYFPVSVEGDHLMWYNMGAYTETAARDVNNMPVPICCFISNTTDVRSRTSSVSEFKTKCQEILVEC